MHPDIGDRPDPAAGLMRWFDYEHLPESLWEVTSPIREVAHEMMDNLPASAEKTTGLRKLLEAKDCFVRAAL